MTILRDFLANRGLSQCDLVDLGTEWIVTLLCCHSGYLGMPVTHTCLCRVAAKQEVNDRHARAKKQANRGLEEDQKALAVGEFNERTGKRPWAAAWGKYSQQEANAEARRSTFG